MNRLILSALALGLAGTPVWAQAPTSVAPSATSPAAVPASPNKSVPDVLAPALSPGANALTEAQAKARIEAAGFSDVNGLFQDKDGTWRGTGTKDGQVIKVGLDVQGSVVAP